MSDFVVAGLGPSMRKLPRSWYDARRVPRSWYDARRVIGVNDFPYRCEHLVVLDGPNEMPEEKRDRILSTLATQIWFARAEWWMDYGELHAKQLGSILTAPNKAKHFNIALEACSLEGVDGWMAKGPGAPTVAASMAFSLGAKRIGLVGIDLSDDHPMHTERAEVENWFRYFARLVKSHGCEVRSIECDALRFMQVDKDWVRACE